MSNTPASPLPCRLDFIFDLEPEAEKWLRRSLKIFFASGQ